MNGHVTQWLGAYHDDELTGFRLHQVETHLEGCATCRAELESLQALSALLQESPVAAELTSPERFVAQVGLKLPRHQAKPAWQRVLETGWRLTPAGLVGAWAFVQTVFFVAGIVLIALQVCGIDVLGVSPTAQRESWLVAGLGILGAELDDAVKTILNLVNVLGTGFALYFTTLATIGLLYWSWLASLWARRRHQQSKAKTQLVTV